MIVERIRRAFGGPQSLSSASSPAAWFAEWIRNEPVASGVAVSESIALNYSAVWAATMYLTFAIASLPCNLYRRRGMFDRSIADDSDLYPLLKDRPNPEQDNVMFWSQQVPCLVNWGNCYAEVERLRNGAIYALWPIHASRVKPFRDGDGERSPVRYEVTSSDGGGAKRYINRADMWHVAGWMSDDGITGKGVVRQARESIGMGLATERFGAGFFGNNAVPGTVLIHPGSPSDQAMDNIRAGWDRAHRGPGKNHGTAVLREAIKVERLGIPPEDAQFLETRGFNVTEIARWYGLPPHVLGDLSRATFSNIESQELSVVKQSLQPWCVRIEKSAKTQLLTPDEAASLYWEFLLDARLRADSTTRTQVSFTRFMHGNLTMNEWRRQENLDPVPGPWGDMHFVPSNLVPIESLVNKPEPEPKSPGVVDESSDDEDPEDDPDDTVSDDSEPDGDTPSDDYPQLAAAKAVVAEALERMRKIARNEVMRAAKHPAKFLSRLDEFRSSHRLVVEAAVSPGVAVLLAVCGHAGDCGKWAATVAEQYDARLAEVVLEIAEAKPSDLEDRAAECLSGERSPVTVDGITI